MATMVYSDFVTYFDNKGWNSYNNSNFAACGGDANSGTISMGKVWKYTASSLCWNRLFGTTALFELPDPDQDTNAKFEHIAL